MFNFFLMYYCTEQSNFAFRGVNNYMNRVYRNEHLVQLKYSRSCSTTVTNTMNIFFVGSMVVCKGGAGLGSRSNLCECV